jgi:long-subunit acyl-CoA synthetase (AMP-forming)
VGRSKEIFKLANGEFCIPTILESYFKIPDVIDEVFVGPSQSNDGVAILVNVNQAYMTQFISDVSTDKDHNRVDSSNVGNPSMLTHAFLNSNTLGLRESIAKLIDETAHHFKVSKGQMPKLVAITRTSFGPLSPFVTSTMKLKRPMLQSLLMDIVAELNEADPL